MSYLLAFIMCHMLLTDVHLADKIIKTEWDRAGGGAQVVAGAEGAEDLIPTNRWLKRVVLPGRVEFMRMALGAGRRPRSGCLAWPGSFRGINPISSSCNREREKAESKSCGRCKATPTLMSVLRPSRNCVVKNNGSKAGL